MEPKRCPATYTSFMVDGMTKRTTSLPSVRVKAKYWCSKSQVLGTQVSEVQSLAWEMERKQFMGLQVDPWYSQPDRVQRTSESSALGLGTDSGESETDEDPTDDALEYVRVQYYVMQREVDGQVDFVVVILSVVRPPASLMGLIYNLALV